MKGKRLSVFSVAAVSVLMIGLTACAAKRVVMVPAPTATIASAPKFRGAEGQADGVRIVAAANEWNGRPGNLENKVTPVRIRIENHSNHPLQISYGDFVLQSPTNEKTFANLPPVDIKGTAYYGALRDPAFANGAKLIDTAFGQDNEKAEASEEANEQNRVVLVPDFSYDGFYPAPYWSYWYNGLSPWPYAWSPAYGYYNQWYPYMTRVHLPTKSMLRKAIPEGVIKPGGNIAGFLYFQKVEDVSQVNLKAKLVDARTGKQFGTIVIPFVVKKQS